MKEKITLCKKRITSKAFLKPLFVFCVFLAGLFLFNGNLHAQNFEAYIIPSQIFVGDPAVLILPLPAAGQDGSQAGAEQAVLDDIVITYPSDFLPSLPYIDFHRIILERHSARSRLRIEFTAFVPGLIELPDIEIGGESFSGLVITVSSVIGDQSSRVFSAPASTLAIPGTALIIYGTLAAVIFSLLFLLLAVFKGRSIANNIINKWKYYRLFNKLRKIEKRLRRASSAKNADKRKILDQLSGEFRTFLSDLTGKNYRAMTAQEFENINTLDLFGADTMNVFFAPFFRKLDDIRFCGADIEPKDITFLLDDLAGFITAIENIKNNGQNERKKQKEEKKREL